MVFILKSKNNMIHVSNGNRLPLKQHYTSHYSTLQDLFIQVIRYKT